MDGAITGQLAVGRYVLHIGEPGGAVVRDASRTERAHIRPRPTPIHRRPKLIRGLLGRQAELAGALSALDAGLPVEASGEPGVGKTALLRHLAYHPRAASFADGVVYLSARHQSFDDVLQLLFEAFNDSEEPCKPTEAEIRRGLQEKQALILLDDVHLKQDELERVLDLAPQSAFAIATRQRCLWGEVRSLALKGLPIDDAVRLLEREIERPLNEAERLTAADLCDVIGGHPLRIVQAAAIKRGGGISLTGWTSGPTPEGLLTELLAASDDKQRRALVALTALPGVPLQIQHIAGIAEVTDVEPSLMTLVRRGVVIASQSKHQLADGVSDRLRRTDDLKPAAHRAITYFTAWAERHQRNPDALLEEAETLLRVQHAAADARRWGEVLLLGRLLEGALVIGARWGAWAASLELSLSAAKATADRSAEARVLHQIGTRALCAGDAGKARAALGQALKLREALNEPAAADMSRRNLRLVLSSMAEASPEISTAAVAEVRNAEPLPLRETAPLPAAPKAGLGLLALTALLFAILGWFGYGAIAAGLSRPTPPPEDQAATATAAPTPGSRDDHSPAPRLYSDVAIPTTDPAPAALPTPTPEPVADRAAIRIFTARPGSVAASGRAGLCYAVDAALEARIDPGVGEVSPASTLTCLRVAPQRTTTYALTASGRDGHHVRQQLVIVVQ
jgi:hypothetical protein